MKNYKENFMKHHDLLPDSFVPCAVCGKQAEHLHHIQFKSQGGSDEIENLEPLCAYHHRQRHGREKDATCREIRV